MSRYRKIDPRIWNDEKFRSFSVHGQLAFFFLLTHPHMTALGGMRASIPGLAAELGWSEEAFREAFKEAFSKGMVEHDETTSLVWLPNFLKYNVPESPNVVKAWIYALDLLPECGLKTRVVAGARAFAEGLSKGFRKAFTEAFGEALPKALPNQELELELEQYQKMAPKGAVSSTSPKEVIFGLGVSLLKARGENEQSARSFLGKLAKNGGETKLAEAIGYVAANPKIDPKAYLAASMKGGGGLLGGPHL